MSATETTTRVLDELKAAAAEGRPAKFARAHIQARDIVDLVRGPAAPAGIQIEGAIIDGTIDLRNVRGPYGGSANTLRLRDCELWSDDPATRPSLDACHSHLSRLSLIECKATGVHLSSAVIDGDLVLDGLGPLPKRSSKKWEGRRRDECWIRAKGIRVGGSITASGAQLSLADQPPTCWSDHSAPYALDLRQARIGGEVALSCRSGGDGALTPFSARGGLIIDGAQIGGDLSANGAELQAVNRENQNHKDICLRGQTAHVNGHVWLNCEPTKGKRFQAKGKVYLRGARIQGAVMLYGASLNRRTTSELRPILVRSRLLACYPKWKVYEAWFAGDGSTLAISYLSRKTGRKTSFVVLDGNSAPIHEFNETGALKLERPDQVTEYLEFFCAHVWGEEGAFAITSGSIEVRATDSGSWRANAQVRYGTGLFQATFEIEKSGLIEMTDDVPIEVVDRLPVRYEAPWRLHDQPPDDGPGAGWTELTEFVLPDVGVPQDYSLDLVIATVSAGIFLRDDDVQQVEFEATDKLDLSFSSAFSVSVAWRTSSAISLRNTHIASSLDLWHGDKSPVILDAGEVRVGGDAILSGTFGRIDLSDGVVEGSLNLGWSPDSPLQLADVPTTVATQSDDSSALRLDNARVGELRVKSLQQSPDATEPKEIDLRGLAVTVLDDTDGRAWGHHSRGDEGKPPGLVLKLGGFRYDRLEDSRSAVQASLKDFPGSKPGEQSSPSEDPAWDVIETRKRWLRLQFINPEQPTDEEYSPQPYHQLAKTWRASGLYSEADKITIEKLRVEREIEKTLGSSLKSRAWHRGVAYFKKLLEFFFGYGLDSRAALLTFAGFWMGGVMLLVLLTTFAPGALRLETSAVGTIVSSDRTVVVELRDVTQGQREVPCGASVDPVTYVFDVIVPILDLGHASRCTISSSPEYSTFGFPLLLWLLGLYKVVGWAVTSGLLLTVSGVVKRQVEK